MTSDIRCVVVLAAGQGKRMKSDLPKVLHPVCGRPMLLHVLEAARSVGAERIVVVLGHGHEQVRPYLAADIVVALQKEQLGTGHAVLAAAEQILPGPMLIMPGDTPLITGGALRDLVEEHTRARSAATVLTMELDDPTGYGRVIRDAEGSVARIVEHRDAEPDELLVHEVNSSIYVLPSAETLEILAATGTDNDQNEVYLTDVVAGLVSQGQRVAAAKVSDPVLVLGVNSREELAEVERLMELRGGGLAH